MTRKERVKKALRHEQPDICPYHIDFTEPILLATAKYLGVKSSEIDEKIGNHFHIFTPSLKWTEVKPGHFVDAFGVLWDRTVDTDIGNVCNMLINETVDLDKYRFPDVRDPKLYSHFNEAIKKNNDKFLVVDLGFSLFERAWTLRGMENLLCDFLADEIFVGHLFDRILEWNMAYIEESLKYPIDAIFFGDDWGQQEGLIMGPEHWRKYIKPRAAQMYKRVKDAGKNVIIHSCGDVEELFPELIEIGVDLFNPFQPEAFNVKEMKRKFGDKISFFGGLSTQKTFPFGSPAEVKAECRMLINEIGKNGGYIFAPAHATPKDVPIENMVAMLDVVTKQS